MDGNCYDHVDFRVRSLRKLTHFYDSLMPALGMRVIRKGDRWRAAIKMTGGCLFLD